MARHIAAAIAAFAFAGVLAGPLAAQVTSPGGSTMPGMPSRGIVAPPPGTPSTVPGQISPRSPTEPMPPPTLDRIEPRAGSLDRDDRRRPQEMPDYRPPAGTDPSGLTRSPYAPPPAIDSGRIRSPSEPMGSFGRDR